MNPLTQTRNLTKLIEREIKLDVNEKASWHYQYKDSAWLFIGGLEYGLNEGDIIAVFSQYGEVVNINLVRDKKTGKSKGYCFLCYEDQRSTILAVDNFNGIKLCKRIIRVDHVENYRVPKDFKDTDEETKKLRDEGCGPDVQMKRDEMAENIDDRSPLETPLIKEERQDQGYDKYEIPKNTKKESERPSHSKVESNKRKRENSKERHIDRRTRHVEDNTQDKHSKNRDDKDRKKSERKEERRDSHRKSKKEDIEKSSKYESSKNDRSSKKRDEDYDYKNSYDHKHSKRKH